MSRKSRELTAEEQALWQYVTRHVKRSSARALAAVAPVSEPMTQVFVQPVAKTSVPPPVPAPQSRALVLGNSDSMDRRTAQRFARGEMAIDARLDLHGMNLAQAEAAVTRFVQSSAALGHRCVIVVTGKGRRGDHHADHDFGEPRGRIRSEAPHWLNRPSLRPLILAVREAHFRHGGGGALYVMLKRRRDSSGR